MLPKDSIEKLKESVADVRKSIDESYELRQFDYEFSMVMRHLETDVHSLEYWVKRTELYLNNSKE